MPESRSSPIDRPPTLRPTLQGLKKRLPRLKLYQQLMVYFIPIVLLPLLGVSFIIYNVNQTALQKELAQFTDHMASALYRDLRTEMSWQTAQGKLLSQWLMRQYHKQPSSFDTNFAGNFQRVASDLMTSVPELDAVGLYSQEGKPIGAFYRDYARTSPELRLPKLMEEPQPPLQPGSASTGQAARSPSPAMRLNVLYTLTGSPQKSPYVLRMTVPVQLSADRPGYLILQKRFPYLNALIESNQSTLHDAVYIIDDTGAIIAGPGWSMQQQRQLGEADWAFFQQLPPGVAQETKTRLPTQPVPAKAEAMGTIPMPPLNPAAISQEERARYTVFVKVPEINWGIIIKSPYHIRQAFIKRARTQTLLLIGGCIGLVILLGIFYILSVYRNFRQLMKGIKAMADGNYDRRIRLITNFFTPFEIVYLASEFNRMARKTAEAWLSSQSLNLELQTRNENERFLNRVTQLLHGLLNLPDISRISLKELAGHLNADMAALILSPSVGNSGVQSEYPAFTDWYPASHVVPGHSALSCTLPTPEEATPPINASTSASTVTLTAQQGLSLLEKLSRLTPADRQENPQARSHPFTPDEAQPASEPHAMTPEDPSQTSQVPSSKAEQAMEAVPSAMNVPAYGVTQVFDSRQWPELLSLGLSHLWLSPLYGQEGRLGTLALGWKSASSVGKAHGQAETDTNEGVKAMDPAPILNEETGYVLAMVANQVGVAVNQAVQWQTIQAANEKLAKLDEMKSNLIDTVSHELRTPLTNIKGYTSRLLRYEETLPIETRRKSLKTIKQQADRLSRLVEDLLVIPDIEQSHLRLFPDQVLLYDLLERVANPIQDKDPRSLSLTWAPETESLAVLADPDRLEQVLVNLLDNALKYALPSEDPDSPTVLVSVQTRPEEPELVQVDVANRCEPLEQVHLGALFEKFKRLDERLTRTTRGSGLGLYITKGLLEAMGGRIELSYRAGWFHATVRLPLFQSPELSTPMGTNPGLNVSDSTALEASGATS
ncbi:MAG: histidine kinase dimerization/phospho-acceptor domain-containing protein [Candidatus Melainabacteria bacterium]|nr:histidine kinase dimerization/phospho-acceptor domain-containing protein [Candidatus Melainabacteria bacterium]